MRFVTQLEINAILRRLSDEARAAVADKLKSVSETTTWREAFGRLPLSFFSDEMVEVVERVLKIDTNVFLFQTDVVTAPGREYSHLAKYQHVYH